MNSNFKILINCSKTLNLSKKIKTEIKKPIFFDKSTSIYNEIKNLSVIEIAKNFKISNKIAIQTSNYFKKYNKDFYYAIQMYDGLVFKQLDLEKYDKKWLNDHVIILDAFYGLIKPYDTVCPYRLDFNYKKLSFNLYNYWKKDVENYLKNYDLYSLASKEYNKILKNLNFIDLNEKWKLNSKKLRGIALDNILSSRKI